jgi:hypothetical protein
MDRRRRINQGERIRAGDYDREIALARLYGWDFWTVQSLPPDYLDELLIALDADREYKDAERAAAEKERRKEAKKSAWSAKNRATLSKMQLRPIQ